MMKFDGSFKSNMFLVGVGIGFGYIVSRYFTKDKIDKILGTHHDTDVTNTETPLDTSDMGPFAVEKEEIDPIVIKDATIAYAVSAGAMADIKAIGFVSVNQLIELANQNDHGDRSFVRDGDRIGWCNVQDVMPHEMHDGSYYVGTMSALKFPEDILNETEE